MEYQLDFLEILEKDYPDVDWDNLPAIDSKPSYWRIEGQQWHRRNFIVKGTEKKCRVWFECGKYSSKQEAQAAIDAMPNNPNFNQEQLIKDQTIPGHPLECNSLRCKEYSGPVIFDTLQLIEKNDDELETLHFCKACRDDILKGNDVFLMFLP